MINKTVLVWDGGLFQSLAHRLVNEYKRVLYFRPWKSSFASPKDLIIGTGYDFERVQDFWDVVDEVDTFVFPDIYEGDLQQYLRGKGKNVWGAGRGEEMELYRVEMKELMQEVGLPVNGYEVVTGMNALRKRLAQVEDKFIKVSLVRGLCETWHHCDYKLSKPKLDDIEHTLGGMSEMQEFLIDDPIPDAVEIGYDGWCIDGQYPKTALCGVEIKDCGYAAQVKPYAALPKQVREVNEKLSEHMKECGYRGFWSTEIRVGKDKKAYLIDPTTRHASPAGECIVDLCGNLGEVIEAGARGEIVEPVRNKRYAAQAIICSEFALSNWQPVFIPGKVRDAFKLYHSCKIDGTEYIVPTDAEMKEIGSVVGVGSSLDEAIKQCRSNAEQIEGYGIKIKLDSLDEAKGELAKISY